MIGVVIDFETNGFYGASVLSAAGILISVDWERKKTRRLDTFLRHYYPVEKWNPYAQEVNGLSAAQIKFLRDDGEYPLYFREDQSFLEFCNNADFAVAHNAKFDSSFLSLSIPWLCTMEICGGKLVDAVKRRGIKVKESELHQALYDAKMCLKLFEYVFKNQHVYLKNTIISKLH